MRVVFLGNAAWSVPSLEALAASRHDLALVMTRLPRPAGRGSRPTPTPVAVAARAAGLPLLEVPTVKAGPGLEALLAARPDVLAVVAYGEILPGPVLAAPAVAPVNVHFSLLPRLRGAAPVQHAFLEGAEETGVTTIRMDEGMDTGPILLQRPERIRPEDDAGSLGDRLASIGGSLLVETLDRLEEGAVSERPQDQRSATYAPKLSAVDRRIEWGDPARGVLRRIRAFSPAPGAETRFRNRILKVLAAEVVPEPSRNDGRGRARRSTETERTPGAIAAGAGGPVVEAGDGALRLLTVQPEGRRRMSGEEFARGYRPESGEILE